MADSPAEEDDFSSEVELPFSLEFDTDQLVEYLEEDFGKKTISLLRKANVNAKSFLAFTLDGLLRINVGKGDANRLVKKIKELKAKYEGLGATRSTSSTSVDSDFAVAEQVSQQHTNGVPSSTSSPKPPSPQSSPTALHRTQGQNAVIVTFQTLLPAHLWGWIGGTNCSLCVLFRIPELSNRSCKLETNRCSFRNGYLVCSGAVHIPIQVIRRYQNCLRYKYCVTTLFVSSVIEEELVFGSKYCRVLKVPELYLLPGNTYRKYDTPVYPSKETLMDTQHYVEQVRHYLVKDNPGVSMDLISHLPSDDQSVRILTFRCFLIDLKSELVNGTYVEFNSATIKRFTKTIKNIYYQINNIDFYVPSTILSYDRIVSVTQELKEEMFEWIFSTATSAVEAVQKSTASSYRYVITGAVLFLLLNYFDLIDGTSDQELSVIMKLLHLTYTVNEEGVHECNGYKVVKKCLSDDQFQKELYTSIESVCAHFISQTEGKSMRWLRVVPLYHFLRDVSQPFTPIFVNPRTAWTFWQKIMDNKANFQKHLSERYPQKIESFWLNLKEQITLDPVLMKVLLYLCPEDQLTDILKRVPPVLATSFICHVCSKKKLNKEEEDQLFRKWLGDLKGLYYSLQEVEWVEYSDQYLEVSKYLVHEILTKLQCSNKIYLSLLRETFHFFLSVVSKLCEHGKNDDPMKYLHETEGKLCSWIRHHNVIGGSSFGSAKGSKVNEEIQIWNTLHSLSCPDSIEHLWRSRIKVIIEQRSEQVSPNKEKVLLFQKISKLAISHQIPEEIMDIFIRMAMEGLSELQGNEAQDAVKSMLSEKNAICTVGKLLSQFIIKRPNISLSDDYIIVDELLNWEIWPDLIEIANQNSPVFKAMEEKPASIVDYALNKVHEIKQSLDDGCITRKDLKKLLMEKEKSHRLLKAAGVFLDISVFQFHLDSLHTYIIAVTTLFHSINSSVEGYEIIQNDLKRDFDVVQMKDICQGWSVGDRDTFVLSSQLELNSPLSNILWPFSDLIKCQIFAKIWWNHNERISGRCISQAQFVEEVWSRTVNDCRNLIIDCHDGSALADDVEMLFMTYKQNEIIEHLKVLFKNLKKVCPNNESLKLLKSTKWIDHVAKQIISYRSFKQCEDTANNLLQLKKCLEMDGSFNFLESVTRKKNMVYNLRSINDFVMKTSKMVEMISSEDKQECLKCVIEYWKIVNWIAIEFKELTELQMFIEVAYTSANITDDDLNIQKLNALRFIGDSVAAFVNFIVKSKEDKSSENIPVNDLPVEPVDQSMTLIEMCNGLWSSLEQNRNLPSLIRECTANIQWYKDIKEAHGDVQVNTLEEVKLLLQYGEFVIGGDNRIPYYKICDILYLYDLSKSRERYDLERLQDLKSRLVLIAGQSMGNEEVQKFLNVFHTVCIIADTLIKLHELGCIQYIGWQRNFFLYESDISHLEEDLKNMSRQLSLWNEAIDEARNKYYVLNSFTMKQLLLLCKKLRPNFIEESTSFTIDEQTCSLLKCLHPCIDNITMTEKLKEIWESIESDLDDCNVDELVQESTIESVIAVHPTTSTTEEVVDTLIPRCQLTFTDQQQSMYVELVETNGLDPLWMVAEILTGGYSNTTEILIHVAEQSEKQNKPRNEELLESIYSSLPNLHLQPALTVPSNNDLSSQVSVEDSGSKHLNMLDYSTDVYISLNQLVKILTMYNGKVHQISNIYPKSRNLSEIDFSPGSPNLYVIPNSKILETALMFYFKDREMPLPTQEEILICDEMTTAEEVMMLCRRAIFDPDFKRIFCLVHGEKLRYSTCETSLRDLNRLKQGRRKYRLAIICSNESSVNSHLVTALHSYRRSNPDISPQLKNYLRSHFVKPKHINIGTSPNKQSIYQASHVDQQCSYIRIVYSDCPGNGKSLYVQRKGEALVQSCGMKEPILSIPIHGPVIGYDVILKKLSNFKSTDPKIIHFDIATSMIENVACFLFSVFVLGHLKDYQGNTWRREIVQMYTIEVTLPEQRKGSATSHLLTLFPKVLCLQPRKCYRFKRSSEFDPYDNYAEMDYQKLISDEYQRVYNYLAQHEVDHSRVMDNPKAFIEVIQRYTNLQTWSEIDSFVKFLNIQLCAIERSFYCNIGGEVWNGFKTFALQMMMEMSKEFTSTSLMGNLKDNNELKKYEIKHTWNDSVHPYMFFNQDQDTFTFIGFCIDKHCHAVNPLTKAIIRPDVMTKELRDLLSRHGVDVSENYYNWPKKVLIEKLTRVIGLQYIVEDPDPSYVITVDNVMKMMAILMRFRCGIPVVIMGETGCGKTRLLRYLCQLASNGLMETGDKANIVVLKVHGGTTQDDIEKAVEKAEILAEETLMIREAIGQSSLPVFGTILFFDEANTTDHINLIKEIMCDHKILGRKIHSDLRIVAACNPYRKHSDDMIRKLESAGLGFSTKVTQTMQKLGSIPLRHLVYRVHELPVSMTSFIFDFGKLDQGSESQYIKKIVENKLKLNLALFKHFGTVICDVLAWSQNYMKNKKDECSFVSLRDIDRAMTVFIFFYELLQNSLGSLINEKATQINGGQVPVIKCQVSRALVLTLGVCYHARLESREDFSENVLKCFKRPLQVVSSDTSQLVFEKELRCCQEVFLDNMKLGRNIARNIALRENVFMMVICISLRIPLFLVGKPGSSKSLAKSIILNSMKGSHSEKPLLRELMQVHLLSYQCSQLSTSESILKVFTQAAFSQKGWDSSKYVSVVVLDEVGLAEDSPNLPLKVLHPLLEDGTEGNSYSVDDVIDRNNRVGFIGISNWALDPAKMNRGIMVIRGKPTLEELEESALQICSEEGIDDHIMKSLKLNFKSFAKAYQIVLQKQEREFFGLRDFYSLVKMLFWMCKTIKQPPNIVQVKHAIFRNFSGFSEHFGVDIIKVFIDELCAIPDPDDIEEARKKCQVICRNEFRKSHFDFVLEMFFEEFRAKHHQRHLEQFKSLHVSETFQFETYQRNQFSHCYDKDDFEDENINQQYEEKFELYFKKRFENELWPFIINPDNTASGLVVSSLVNKERTMHGESRYLLFLTENYSALQTLQHFLTSPELKEDSDTTWKTPYILFGSSFPKDKDFTQVYRNINNIKVCMETGRTVVLLNLDHLYESLYDALNQYYIYFGNMRYVDLGLQNHRVKCRVHDNFKLILIAEKEKVYKEFPTALINRLEKHFVVTSTILLEKQQKIENELKNWISNFSIQEGGKHFKPSDSFIGYQNDTPAAVVFQASRMMKQDDSVDWHKKVLINCKFLLLQIATPDALIRLKRSRNLQEGEYEEIAKVYIEEQRHRSLKDFLSYQINKTAVDQICRMQVTTCNDLLSEEEVQDIKKSLELQGDVVTCILQEFDTEFEFSRKVREAFQIRASLLIIQCDSGHLNSDLLACAKYRVDDICEDVYVSNECGQTSFKNCCHILFTVLIPREHNESSFVSFLGGEWTCAHIDDFSPEYDYCPVTLSITNTPLSLLFNTPDAIIPSSPSSSCSSFNHCQFLYKNIAEALIIWNPDSKIAGRSHEVNDVLYRLLMNPINNDFYNATVLCICQDLKTHENEDWIFQAASESTWLRENGAFVKVLLHSLDSIVNQTLAQIVAYADINYNLELIDPLNNSVPHLRTFWINAYTKLINHHLNNNLHFGKYGRDDVYDYRCQFPFSRELQQAMEVVVKIQQGIDTDNQEAIADHLHLKYEILNEISVSHYDDMLRRYTCDLIQLKYSRTFRDDKANNKGLDFICTAILQSLSRKESAQFTDMLKSVHQILDKRRMEISNFKNLIVAFPSILDKLTPSEILPLDVLAAIIALDLIDEDYQLLLKPETRSPTSVISKLHRFCQVTNVIDTALYSVELDEITGPRLKWQALQVVHLFIEHVIRDHLQYFDRIVQFMNRIRTMFIRNQCDFTKKDTVRKLEMQLSLMNTEFSEAHSQTANSFAQSCINFYIAVISNVCMKQGEPDDDLVDKLIETVFTVAEDNSGSQTRVLTPFITSSKFNDDIPVIRSYILQLLLHKKFHSARKHIEIYFQKAELLVSKSGNNDVLISLKLLYCQLYENSLHGSTVNAGVLLPLLNGSKDLLPDRHCDFAISLNTLEAVATVRFVLMHLSELLMKENTDNNENMLTLLSSVEALCRRSSTSNDNTGPRMFLLKSLFRRWGQTGIQEIINKPHLKWIKPERIFDGISNHLCDYFAIYGETYCEIRKIVIELIVGKKFELFTNLKEKIVSKPYFLIMVIFMEITLTFSNTSATLPKEVMTEFGKFVRTEKCLSEDLQDLGIALMDNLFSDRGSVEQLYVQPERSLADKIFTSIAVHITTGVIAMKDSILLHVFYTMLTAPETLKDVYLPSMPEDFTQQLRSIFRGQFYVCPNGHPYMVTECGAPMEEKLCSECNKIGIVTKIGGLNHRLREDNSMRGQPKQTGYILGTPVETSAIPERSLSPAANSIVKIFIHSILLWTCCSKSTLIQKVHEIVTYDIEASDLPRYFWQHLVSNFNSLCEVLSVGLDDAAVVIHLIIAEILAQKLPHSLDDASFDLLSMKSRQNWEREFNHMYIQPVLMDLHKRLEMSRASILEDERSNHPLLLDYVYERNIPTPEMIHHLWKYRPAVTLEHILQQLQVRNLTRTYPALTYFLQEEVCLRATKFLPAIYQLQHFLHNLHHYRSSHEELLRKTIGEFLDELGHDGEREKYKLLIWELRTAWMLVRGKLQTEKHLPHECVSNDFLDNTTIIHLIPRKNSCITSLVDYLVMVHNEFISVCLKNVRELATPVKVWKSFRKDHKVKLKDLNRSQLLSYDDKLTAMILSHGHYSLTVGKDQKETLPDYDFAALEKHLLNEFVYGKPCIENESLFVEFRKEVYTGKRFDKIKEKVKPEVSLSSEAKRELLAKLNRIQQLKEALDQIEIVMGFLSAGGKENGLTPLKDYATNVLKINKFNNVLGEGHCLGQIHELWSVVSLELSIKATIAGDEPYQVPKCFCEPLQESDLANKLEHINLDILLSALNEFIEVHVRNAEENQSQWTIGECMEGYYGVLPDKLSNEVKLISEIEMKNVIDIWKKLVKHSRNCN